MSKKLCLGLLLVRTCSLASCSTMKHKVGSGGGTASTVEWRQWWAPWGIVPLNHVDSHTHAAGATDSTAITQFKPLDVVISFFTGFATIYCQSIEVQK